MSTSPRRRSIALALLLLGATACAPNHSAIPVVDGAISEDHFRPIGQIEVTTELVGTTETAVDVAFRPGDDALYVVEQAGRVVRLAGDEAAVVADVGARLAGHGDEQGLTGLEFSADGAVAWLHSTTPAEVTTISEVRVGADGMFDLATERSLIETGDPPGVNHNAGDLLLLDDGTLLITLGDGKAVAPGDPYRVGQDPTEIRGTILRVRPTPDDPTAAYEVPDDNPFATGTFDSGRATIEGAPEVFAWGLRNPWKISIDAVSDTLWIADVGARRWEEIDVVRGDGEHPPGWGRNFGWSRFEGRSLLNADVEIVGDDHVDPIHVYEHDELRCAVSGGEVYRGSAIPDLWSGYVFGDFCEGSVFVLDRTTGEVRPLLTDIPGISGVRAEPDGELLVLSWFGEIRRIVPA